MINSEMRKDCPMRDILGNCSPVGGFCIDAVSDEICEAVHHAYDHGFCNAVVRMLKEQPDIVRCKDCKYGYMLPNSSDYVYCTKPYSGTISHKPDWFCADGERRDGNG